MDAGLVLHNYMCSGPLDLVGYPTDAGLFLLIRMSSSPLSPYGY